MSEEDVGPGRPPVRTRYRKGESGNLKGRPKGRGKRTPEKSGSAFDIVIGRTLTVTQGGVPRGLTVEEAMQHRTYQEAIGGNRSAQHDVLKMILKRDKALSARKGPVKITAEHRMEPVDPENADQALLILGVACRDPVREELALDREPLQLEPWAVQLALSRRRGAKPLNEREVAEIRRCTGDAETLHWPRGTDA